MHRFFRNRRLLLCLLASLALHMLFLWAYQRWAAEPVLRALRPERFALAPPLEPEGFEPVPRATVPEVVMEQLRLAELMEAPLPEEAMAPPAVALESLAPPSALEMETESRQGPVFLPGDTVSYEGVLADLYRRKLVELQERRIRVLPLADTTSEAGRRRSRAREIIDRAIEAMGGLERLQAIRDKRVEVRRWDGVRQIWKSVGERSYLRGDRYRLDIGPRLARGYDGRQSWHLHYGLLQPPRDERHNAERWDFLTRFRGDGLVVEYVGRRKLHYRTLEAVRVIDTVFGHERLAYFDLGDSLLYAEVDAGRTTIFRQYRETQGVLTPFEIGGGYRWHTELNTGLTAERFKVPEPVSWDPELVRMAIFEHAPLPPGGPAALRLQLEELTQFRGWLPGIDRRLIDAFMKRKMQAAGVLAGTDPPDWRLTWRVVEFWKTPDRPPAIHRRGLAVKEGFRVEIARLKIAVCVQSLRDEGLWEGLVVHKWVVSAPETEVVDWAIKLASIDYIVADSITWEVILKASAGIRQLLDARKASDHPGPTPRAGRNTVRQ